MNISTLTTKYQATIPSDIREELNLHAGDKLGFRVDHDQVIIFKIQPFDLIYHQALSSTLSEWDSKEDEAYNDL